MTDKAINKIQMELAGFHGGQAENIMKNDVARVLCDFCRQDGEFAQAVVQGGNFDDCMKAVARNARSGISDLEAFKRAVQFYFPGADIRMRMEIDLCASVSREDPEPAAAPARRMGVVLDLTDFL